MTRLVAGGVILGLLFKKAKKHDSRELYLVVETPEVVSAIKCDPNEGMQARQFASKVNTAARQAGESLRMKSAAIRGSKGLSRVRTKDARPVLRGLGSSTAPWLPGTFDILGRARRLSRDYEREDVYSESMFYLASISSLLRRLAPSPMTATRYHITSRAA